jgi:hypothetical protein
MGVHCPTNAFYASLANLDHRTAAVRFRNGTIMDMSRIQASAEYQDLMQHPYRSREG